MSSINIHPTFFYQQPEEYRFSHDSIFLAYKVFETLQNLSLKDCTLLDLCSGVGVVGLDFIYHRHKAHLDLPKQFDFLEVQHIYKKYFDENIKTLSIPLIQAQFIHSNYDQLLSTQMTNSYDYIISNPPYFHTHHGKLSPSHFKNRCRFFIDSNFKNLILGLSNALKPLGSAFVLFRDQPEHSFHVITEIKKYIPSQISVVHLDTLRGTLLIQFTKN